MARNMTRNSTSGQWLQALDRVDLQGPPMAPLVLYVKGHGTVELWGGHSEAKSILEALAEITGEPLHQIVNDVHLLSRSPDGEEERDVTPPEIDAWHWPELEESFYAARRAPRENRRRGSKRGRR